MLGFLRKHQKYFWIGITIVIVISFSFFGTYSTLQEREIVDPIAFKAVNGSVVHQSEVEEMVKFIATDTEDKAWMGGAWGPNFLNDGVIKNDLIQDGLAELLVISYANELKDDLNTRIQKEKRFKPYENSQASFISSANAWKYFVPDINNRLEQLQTIENAASPEAIQVRMSLFQNQRQFPPHALRQALRYQEQQFKWLQPDISLQRSDLSLFGYHTVEDWFGPRFLRLVSAFIINSSIIAEQRGYNVSKEEAYADLVKNAELSFEANQNNPNLGVATSSEYFSEQLRRMGMDLSSAISIWQKVLECRRLFNEEGNSVFVDSKSINLIYQYAQEGIEGELYQLPEQFRLADATALKQFEFYLGAVSKNGEGNLELPNSFLSAEEVSKTYPELVQKRYLIEIASIDKEKLQSKVSIKETWNWEVQDANWEKLKKEFSDIGAKTAANQEERYQALDSLDNKTRTRIDAYARAAIVNAHPEWVTEALEKATPAKKVIAVRKKGGKSPLVGVEKAETLIPLFDNWSKSEYTPDNRNYYKIQVLEKGNNFEILTFGEARADGTLDKLLEKGPKKDYASLVESISKDYTAANPAEKRTDVMLDDYAASLRLYAYVRDIRNKMSKNNSNLSAYVQKNLDQPKDQMHPREPLEEQFKLVKTSYSAERSTPDVSVDMNEALALPENGLSKVYDKRNGELSFFKLIRKGQIANKEGLYQNVYQMQRMLGKEAEGLLMKDLIKEFQEKNAIVLK